MDQKLNLFNVSSELRNANDEQIAGLYDKNGVLKIEWDEIIKREIIRVNENGNIENCDVIPFQQKKEYFDECTLIIPSESPYLVDGLLAQPVEITKIDDNAFLSLPIRNVILPNSIEVIGSGAFYECDKLENIYADYKNSNIKLIEEYAFGETSSLQNILHTHKLEAINDYAYEHSGIRHIDVDSLNIGAYAFNQCYNLESVYINIQKNQGNIDASAFIGSDYVKSVYGNIESGTDLSFMTALPIDTNYRFRYDGLKIYEGINENLISENDMFKDSFSIRTNVRKGVEGAEKSLPDIIIPLNEDNKELKMILPNEFNEGILQINEEVTAEESIVEDKSGIENSVLFNDEQAQENQPDIMPVEPAEDRDEQYGIHFFINHNINNVGLYPKDYTPSEAFIMLASAKSANSKFDDIYKENNLYMRPNPSNIKGNTYHIDVPDGFAGAVFGKERQNLNRLTEDLKKIYPEINQVVVHKKPIADFSTYDTQQKEDERLNQLCEKDATVSIDDEAMDYYVQSAMAELEGMAEDTNAAIDELINQAAVPEDLVNDVKEQVNNVINKTSELVNDKNINTDEKIHAINSTKGFLSTIYEKISILIERIDINKEALLNRLKDFSMNCSIKAYEKDIDRLTINEKSLEVEKAKLLVRKFVFNKPKKVAEIECQISLCKDGINESLSTIQKLKDDINERHSHITERRMSLDRKIEESKEFMKNKNSLVHDNIER